MITYADYSLKYIVVLVTRINILTLKLATHFLNFPHIVL
jgi:hypothetical protein